MRGNVLAPKTLRGNAWNFFLNLGWSLYWLTRSVRRTWQRREM
nr:hypothetical protein [uncultured Selenomonas sp.]